MSPAGGRARARSADGPPNWEDDFAPVLQDFQEHARYQLYKANRASSVPAAKDGAYLALYGKTAGGTVLKERREPEAGIDLRVLEDDVSCLCWFLA